MDTPAVGVQGYAGEGEEVLGSSGKIANVPLYFKSIH